MASRSSLGRTIFRTLLRRTRDLQRISSQNSTEELKLWQPPVTCEWGKAGWTKVDQARLDQALAGSALAALPGMTEVRTFAMLREAIRAEVNLGSPSVEELDQRLDAGFEAIRRLGSLIPGARCMDVTETDGVKIEASSGYVPDANGPEDRSIQQQSAYTFAYRMRITNCGDTEVKLTGRHLTFEDSEGKKIVVPKNSRGVVGYTPRIKPGETFQYHSGVTLETDRGFLVGSFQMIKFKGRESTEFDAHFGPVCFLTSNRAELEF